MWIHHVFLELQLAIYIKTKYVSGYHTALYKIGPQIPTAKK